MPKIFNAPANVSGVIGGRRASADDLSGGRGFALAGDALLKYADKLEDREERKAGLYREKVLASDRLFADTRLKKLQDTLPNGGEGAADILSRELQKRFEDNGELMPTRRAREDYGVQTGRLVSRYMSKAVEVDAAAVARGERITMDEITTSIINEVALDPDNLPYGLAHVNGLIATSRLQGLGAEEYRREIYEILYATAANAMIAPSRVLTSDQTSDALEELKSDKWVDNVPPKNYASVLQKAENLISQYRAKEQAAFVQTAVEKIQEITAGVEGVNLTEAGIRGAIDDASIASALVSDLEIAVEIGGYARDIKTSSPGEISALVSGIKEDILDPGNFASDTRRMDSVSKAIATRNAEINNDRVSYVLMNFPSVAEAYERFRTAPQDAQGDSRDEYVSELLTAQEQLGVDPWMLSKQQVYSIGEKVDSVGRDPDSADKLRNELGSLARVWGNKWPLVYRQLVSSGAISGGHIVLANISGDIDKNAVSLNLATALSLSSKDMFAGVENVEGFKADLHDAVVDASADFFETLGWQGASKTVGIYQDTIARLATYYITQTQKMSLEDAVDRAYEELVGSDYSFNGSYRVPSNYNDEMVSRGISYLKDKLEAEPMLLPTTPDGGSLSQGQLAASLKDLGRFVTNPDETGVLLVDENGRQVMRPDGKTPVEFLFQFLQDLGSTASAAIRPKR